MDNKPDVFEKIKTMSKDELIDFLGSVKIASYIANSVGILAVMTCLFFPNIFVILISLTAVYGFAGISVGADNTMAFINTLLKEKYNHK